MKKKIVPLISLFLLPSLSVTFLSCEQESNSELGEKAGKEFCNCLDAGNSLDDCENKLKKKYQQYEYTSDDFVKAFNEAAAYCDVYITVLD